MPLIFTVGLFFSIRDYVRRLNPVTGAMRMQFGELNAGLAETISGIEVVKSTAQEGQERASSSRTPAATATSSSRTGRFRRATCRCCSSSIALVFAFLHGLYLVNLGQLTVGELVAYMGLHGTSCAIPTFISIFTFSLVQLGIAGAERILELMREETELDENASGHRGDDARRDRLRPRHLRLRRRADPAQNVSFTRRAGPDDRHRRADRLRQEHADQAGQPHLRCDRQGAC